MEITRQLTHVQVSLPVTYSTVRSGQGGKVVYNVSVGGLVSLFESLPESVKVEIMQKLAEKED